MRILVIGNMGYVGPAVVERLRRDDPDGRLECWDAAYFAHCLTGGAALPERIVDRQSFGDARDIPAAEFEGVEACVYLAAISNDPMGETFSVPTREINCDAALRAARLARDAGVPRFVYASSCSLYGASGGAPRVEADELNPLTAYARSKAEAEAGLRALATRGFSVTALRFATACGMSPRLRLDLVLNDFVASAVATGRITVLSDGEPWRPLIAVEDMAAAASWAVRRDPRDGGEYLAVNAGRDDWNFQVKDIAAAVARAVPGTRVALDRGAPADRRSYRVDFSLFRSLAPGVLRPRALEETIRGVADGLRAAGFASSDFRDSAYMRVNVLKGHVSAGRLDGSLRWTDRVRLAPTGAGLDRGRRE